MDEKNAMPNDSKNKNPKSKKKMLYGIIVIVVLVLIATAIFKKSNKNMEDPKNSPQFSKQGELTFSKADRKPVISIDIEIADSPDKREVGLMGRISMEEKQGMLFVFDEELLTAFWMRNTFIPLDIIFIDKSGKIVTICKDTEPLSDQTYQPSRQFLYVVEVNAGFTSKYNVSEGDRIDWKRAVR